MSLHEELQNVTAKLTIDNVSKTFNSARGKVDALKNVSLKVDEGEFVCLVGPYKLKSFHNRSRLVNWCTTTPDYSQPNSKPH